MEIEFLEDPHEPPVWAPGLQKPGFW